MNKPRPGSVDEWLSWLQSLSPRKMVLGLERVQEVIERLDLERPQRIFTVAGTNGKGSSVAMLDAILQEAGFTTAAYTSPHLRIFNERFKLNGQAVGDARLISALERIESVRGDIPLTFFEFGTLAALALFAESDADCWILEVGLGGRLDAVNAIDPDVSLITNIALDHCAWLGDDLESIAYEKAGIMRADKPVIFASQQVPQAIIERAASTGAKLKLAGEDFAYQALQDQSWNWYGENISLESLALPAVAGDWQLHNASAVLAAIEAADLFELETTLISHAMQQIRLEGRFQHVHDNHHWVFDVAHNPHAALALREQLQAQLQQTGGRLICVLGMLADKDLPAFLEPLETLVDEWSAVSIESDRGSDAAATAAMIANQTGKPCSIHAYINDALMQATSRAGSNDTVLVTGSFKVVGPALQWIDQRLVDSA